MASQVVTETGLEVLEISSYIRGYHAYMDIWEPAIGETLLTKMEPTNDKDSRAVAVVKDGEIVGHVPLNLAPKLFQFLRREVNKAFVEVTGAGYGLEIPLWPSSVHQQDERDSRLTCCCRTPLASCSRETEKNKLRVKCY